MSIKSYQFLSPINHLIKVSAISERALSTSTNLSRTCIRHIIEKRLTITLSSLKVLADYFNLDLHVILSKPCCNSEFSTIALCYKVERDGFDSWKIHYMDFIDQFRREPDPRLIILPPIRSFDRRLTALLAALVRSLCKELAMSAPAWSEKRYFLEEPWFPAEMNSLKASAIIESPIEFRNNNIYVLENFTRRA